MKGSNSYVYLSFLFQHYRPGNRDIHRMATAAKPDWSLSEDIGKHNQFLHTSQKRFKQLLHEIERFNSKNSYELKELEEYR